MFEKRSQQSKPEVEARIERSQNSSHEQTCFLLKRHSRTSPDVQFKEISLTKQKTRPRTDNEWIGKTI